MKQREVQDGRQTTWTLVQALSGGDGAVAQAAEQRLQDSAGRVPVVATPSGGEQSRRLQLPVDWHDTMSDDQLRDAVQEADSG
jgi:hypothetical protein